MGACATETMNVVLAGQCRKESWWAWKPRCVGIGSDAATVARNSAVSNNATTEYEHNDDDEYNMNLWEDGDDETWP